MSDSVSPITATIARKKTNEALDSIDKMAPLRLFIESIESRIVEATSEGKSSITNPFNNFKDQQGKAIFPPSNGPELLRMEFKKRGFDIVDHPNPDPGDIRSSSYTTLSW
jgi:hypothetical protein